MLGKLGSAARWNAPVALTPSCPGRVPVQLHPLSAARFEPTQNNRKEKGQKTCQAAEQLQTKHQTCFFGRTEYPSLLQTPQSSQDFFIRRNY